MGSEVEPVETFEQELALIENLSELSETEVENFFAGFTEEDLAEAEALEQEQIEEALADSEKQWFSSGPELTEEEEEERMEEFVQALEPIIAKSDFRLEDEDEVAGDLEQLLEELLE